MRDIFSEVGNVIWATGFLLFTIFLLSVRKDIGFRLRREIPKGTLPLYKRFLDKFRE